MDREQAVAIEVDALDIGANAVVAQARAEAKPPVLVVEAGEVAFEGSAIALAQADSDEVIGHLHFE